MAEESTKKRTKKKKHVSWDDNPPIVSHCSGTEDKRSKKVQTTNIKIPIDKSQLDESEPDLLIDTDVDENLPSTLCNLEEEIEKQLEEKAAKNNLSVTNVKNILKAVITNKDVVEMVNTSLKGESFDNFRPKFTRSKTKELLDSFDLEQVESKCKSDYAYILDEELPEDSDDEEYAPNEDSDEEKKTVELMAESPMPDSPYFSSICGDEDIVSENGENIGQRTRSKLSLSETPLEAIEQQFVPPDITTDMYDTECDNKDWLDFLKDIQKPIDRTCDTIEDDNDPEYNVMVEDSVEPIDFEELRHDRAVKVTKAELHALMNEWFGCEDFSSEDEVETQKSVKVSPQKDKGSPRSSDTHLLPSRKPNELELELIKNLEVYKRENFFNYEQYCLLIQQLQQHIQLLLQGFLLTYRHPYVQPDVPSSCKEMLTCLNCLSQNIANSTFNVINLKSSLSLLQNWENYMSNSNNSIAVTQFMEKEFVNGDMSNRKRKRIIPAKLPPQLMTFCADSTAFIFPFLLPDQGVIYTSNYSGRMYYSCHENHLIALGLQEFSEEFISRKNSQPTTIELCRLICSILMPHKEPRSILSHIMWLLKRNDDNPVKFYYEHNCSPPIKHYVVSIENCVKLRDHPQQLIPPNWKKHLFQKRYYMFPLIKKMKSEM